jgi:hypothetical protein
MEFRRRQERRRMTELGIQTQVPLLPWEIKYPADLMKFRWQPPTLQSQTLPPLNGPRSILDSWLDSLWPTESTTDEAQPTQIEKARVEAQQLPGVQTRRQLFETLDSLSASFDAARANHMDLDAYRDAYSGLKDACRLFKQSLALGSLTEDQLENTWRRLTRMVQSSTGASSSTRDEQLLRICASAVAGIKACKVLQPRSFRSDFWSGLMGQISNLPVTRAMCQLVKDVFDCVAGQSISIRRENSTEFKASRCIQDGMASMLLQILRSADPPSRQPTVEAEPDFLDTGTATIAGEAIGVLGKAERRQLFDLLLRQLSTADSAKESIAWGWLSTLARCSGIGTKDLFDVAGSLERTDAQCRLQGYDICRLIIARWGTRGYADELAVLNSYHQTRLDKEECSLAALALTAGAFQRNRRLPAYFLLWNILRKLDRVDEFMASLRALVYPYLWEELAKDADQLSCLVDLAWTSRDVRICLEICRLYNIHNTMDRHQRPPWPMEFWDILSGYLNEEKRREDVPRAMAEAVRRVAKKARREGEQPRRARAWLRRPLRGIVAKQISEHVVKDLQDPDHGSQRTLQRLISLRRFLARTRFDPSPAVSRGISVAIRRRMAATSRTEQVSRQWFQKTLVSDFGAEGLQLFRAELDQLEEMEKWIRARPRQAR